MSWHLELPNGERVDLEDGNDLDELHDKVMGYLQRPEVYEDIPSAEVYEDIPSADVQHEWCEAAVNDLYRQKDGRHVLPNGHLLKMVRS